MITFKQFLGEGAIQYDAPSRVSPLEIVEAIDLIEKYCQKFLKAPGVGDIVRGFNLNGEAGIGDSEAGEARRSANTFNYYTLWMDNHEAWKGWPKRSRSFICSETSNIASGFGKPYLVFPFDDAKIAACADEDLWTSFEELRNIMPSGNLARFMKIVHSGIKANGQEPPETYPELVRTLKKLTFDHVSFLYNEEKDSRSGNAPYLLDLMNLIDDAAVESVYELFEKVIEPSEFELFSNPSKYLADGERELFIQGRCIFISYSLAHGDSAAAALFQEFLNKHEIEITS
jgi:hypothetical protein